MKSLKKRNREEGKIKELLVIKRVFGQIKRKIAYKTNLFLGITFPLQNILFQKNLTAHK